VASGRALLNNNKHNGLYVLHISLSSRRLMKSFMKHIYKIVLPVFLGLFGFLNPMFAQNIPVDFETDGNGANWNWKVFENDSDPALEIVDNPDKSGINTSCTVAKFTALKTGKPFAGCETMHGADIGEFTISESNKIIKIMVWKSVISDVGIKLVRSDNWSLGELKIPNTKINQWEVITFDFSAHIGNTYDQIVVFPDFDNSGRAQDNIVYFDNVYGTDSVEQSCGTSAIGSVEESTFNLFPNPSSDVLNIQSHFQVEKLHVYNALGNRIESLEIGSSSYALDVSAYKRGVYVIEAQTEGRLVRKKVVLH
jgi:hypothetical protein